MRGKRIHYLSVVVALVALLAACGEPPEHLASYDIEDSEWRVADTARWSWEVKDTSQSYDLFIEIRHSSSYPYANLYLFVEIVSPDGATHSDTLDYPLCAPSGEWYGEGFSNNRTVALPYRTACRFAQVGEYTFCVRQGMRRDPLVGIHEVSLIAYKHEDGEK